MIKMIEQQTSSVLQGNLSMSMLYYKSKLSFLSDGFTRHSANVQLVRMSSR